MTWLTIAQLLMTLAGGLVSTLRKQPGVPAEVLADAEAAAAALQRVAGSEVTKSQLDALTFTPQW